MTEELKAKIDKYVKDTCVYYRSTHEDMLPSQFEKYLRSACVHFITEATKELEEQIDKLTKELDEYKNIDKRLICNHKYFTSDIKNNNLAVVCHSILDCNKCGRWEEE